LLTIVEGKEMLGSPGSAGSSPLGFKRGLNLS
jgi:hypothetical protein